MVAYKAKIYPAAIQYLGVAKPMLPRIADYLSYYLAAANVEGGDFTGAARELADMRSTSSPLAAKAAMLGANLSMHGQDYLGAIKVLRETFETLPHPEADELLARAYEGQGERVQAAVLYQRVYYTQPATTQAIDAAAAIERLKRSMGKEYPPPHSRPSGGTRRTVVEFEAVCQGEIGISGNDQVPEFQFAGT